MTCAPTISVIIPLYNNKAYISAAIKSVLAQTFPVHEIVVVDDASTDGSAELVETHFSANPEVRLVRCSHGGASATRNKGLELASGDYVAFLDSDDLWLPHKLERQMALFSAHPEVGVVYCSYGNIDGNGDPVPEIRVIPPRLRGDVFLSILAGGAISGSASAVVARRACLDRAGKFDEAITLGEDWDIWLRLARHARFDFIDEPLTLIRRHLTQTQACEGWAFRLRQSSDHVRLWSKWPEDMRHCSKALMLMRRRMLSPAFSPDMTLRERIMAPARIAEAIWPIAHPDLMKSAWGCRSLMAISGGGFVFLLFISRRVIGKSRRVACRLVVNIDTLCRSAWLKIRGR